MYNTIQHGFISFLLPLYSILYCCLPATQAQQYPVKHKKALKQVSIGTCMSYLGRYTHSSRPLSNLHANYLPWYWTGITALHVTHVHAPMRKARTDTKRSNQILPSSRIATMHSLNLHTKVAAKVDLPWSTLNRQRIYPRRSKYIHTYIIGF